MYKTFETAVKYGLLPEDALEDWDASITKSEAVEYFVSMVTNYTGNSGAGHTIHDDGYVSEEALEAQEAARRENAETAAFGETLPGDGTVDEKLRDWVKSQGADYMLGWTIIFEHGKGAGDQPTYGIYMDENSERYLERFEVGDYLPCNTQLTGTMEEFMAWQAQNLKDTIMENGEEGEDYRIEDDGNFVIIID